MPDGLSPGGDWVVVTGGTGGIGAALAGELAAANLRPAIGFRGDKGRADELAKAHGGEAVPLNLLDEEQIKNAAEYFANRRVIALVLNASPPLELAPFREISADMMRRQIEASAIGNQRLLAHFIDRVFRPRRSGMVIGILTKAMGSDEEAAMKLATPYVVAKYALLGLLRSVKSEHRWLQVHTVYPGFTDTAMLNAFEPRFVELLREQKAIGTPNLIARQIVQKIVEKKTDAAQEPGDGAA